MIKGYQGKDDIEVAPHDGVAQMVAKPFEARWLQVGLLRIGRQARYPWLEIDVALVAIAEREVQPVTAHVFDALNRDGTSSHGFSLVMVSGETERP